MTCLARIAFLVFAVESWRKDDRNAKRWKDYARKANNQKKSMEWRLTTCDRRSMIPQLVSFLIAIHGARIRC